MSLISVFFFLLAKYSHYVSTYMYNIYFIILAHSKIVQIHLIRSANLFWHLCCAMVRSYARSAPIDLYTTSLLGVVLYIQIVCLMQTNEPATSSAAESASTSATPDPKKPSAASGAAAAATTASKDESAKNKPLIPKSAILRLLAELVMSYAGIAQAVAQYQYMVGHTKHVKEVGFLLLSSFLAHLSRRLK